MNVTLERLVQLKTAATTTAGQIDYLDQILTDAVTITRRPGDIERCATLLDDLVTEVATTRALQRLQEPARATNDPDQANTGAHALINPQEAL